MSMKITINISTSSIRADTWSRCIIIVNIDVSFTHHLVLWLIFNVELNASQFHSIVNKYSLNST